VLHLHAGIKEAAVVSMPHPRLGEGICAYLIPAGEERPEMGALSIFVSEAGLAKQKCPERIEWVESLPRTASGKIRKDQLRAMIKALIEEEKAGWGGALPRPRLAPFRLTPPIRHCERSEAIQSGFCAALGTLRRQAPREDRDRGQWRRHAN